MQSGNTFDPDAGLSLRDWKTHLYECIYPRFIVDMFVCTQGSAAKGFGTPRKSKGPRESERVQGSLGDSQGVWSPRESKGPRKPKGVQESPLL